MAVYTNVTEQEVRHFLENYAIGHLVNLKPIAQGVENSNFLLETSKGKYILTLFEKRVKADDLPWYLGLMQYLAEHNVACPLPVETIDHCHLMTLNNRPTTLVTFLEGEEVTDIKSHHCFALGVAMAHFHQIGQGYTAYKKNNVGPDSWDELLTKSANHDHDGLIREIYPILQNVLQHWPSKVENLPKGQIHADLFPDNVLFQSDQLTGFIDFYFACTDFFAYDLAIALNAWCFTDTGKYSAERANALVQGYQSVRLLTEQEKLFFPLFKMGAALRFLLTRLHDLIHTPPTALVTPKDPYVYLYRLRHFQHHEGIKYQ